MAGEAILIVDDNSLNLKVARVLLSSEGYLVRTAADGEEMFRVLETFVPKLILMDIQLPGRDGLELTRMLKADPRTRDILVIALTAYAMVGDDKRAAEAGCDGYITKPVDPETLPATIAKHLGRVPPGDSAGPKTKVLVIEDNAITAKLVRITLESGGYEVLSAPDGRTAHALCREHRPELVLTDLRLPDVDGCQLAVTLRAEPGMGNAVVLAFTGFVEGAEEERVARAGFDGYLVKPVEPGGLLALVGQHLSDRKANGETAQSRAVPQVSLSRQISLQAAAFSVLSTISASIAKSMDIETALPEILSGCLDGVGLSSGALGIMDSEGAFVLRAQVGFDGRDGQLRELIERLREPLERGSTVVWSTPEGAAVGADLLKSIHLRGALIVPLVSRERCLGALLLSSDSDGIDYQQWIGYAKTVASQLAQAISLSRLIGRLADSEDRYRSLMKHALDGIGILSLQGEILELNPSMAALLGRTEQEVLGRQFVGFVESLGTERIQEDLRRLSSEGKVVSRNLRLTSQASKKPVYVDFSANVISLGGKPTVLAIVHDMTERADAEEQLRQAQKMEAVGLLAGGVAHDFNNILAVILMYCESLLERTPQDSRAGADALGIKQAADRAAALTRQLLIFSRKQISNPKAVDLNALLRDLEKMLGRLIGEDIRLEVQASSGVIPVWIDPNQFDQVVMNLAVNARDAMPGGGWLGFETRVVEVQEGEVPPLRQGRYALLSVSDSGCGMDSATLSKIFEPFFTTKAAGRGTGLGLSTVVGIVKKAEGHVAVSSQPGKGTRFSIYLPIHSGAFDRVTPSSPGQADLRGSETLLFVEDEPALRLVTAAYLRENGYQVLEARDGVEAFAICAGQGDKVDLAITDVLMPNMSGPEFVRKVMELPRGRQIKALFLSGYGAEEVMGALPKGDFKFMEKPYSGNGLLVAIREVLGKK